MKRSLMIISSLVLALTVARAAAAAIPTISVSPVTKTVTVLKGGTEEVIYTAYNPYDTDLSVTVAPRYWHMLGSNKNIPINSWLKIEPTEFTIGPKEKKEVRFIITVPEEAAGELATMISFKPEAKERYGVNIVFSVSLYVIISGTDDIGARISGVKLWKHENRDALGIMLKVSNTGNVHLKPEIKVFINDLFNKTLKSVFLKFGKPVYPDEETEFNGTIYNFVLKPGVYKAVIDIEDTIVGRRFQKKVYFIAGRRGRILWTFLRRPAR